MSGRPTITNVANEAQVKTQGDIDRRRERRAVDDLRSVMSTPFGRRFVWRQLEVLDRISMHSSGAWTSFNEGERNVALKLKSDVVQHAPQAFLLMQEEHLKELEGDSQE